MVLTNDDHRARRRTRAATELEVAVHELHAFARVVRRGVVLEGVAGRDAGPYAQQHVARLRDLVGEVLRADAEFAAAFDLPARTSRGGSLP